MKCVCQTGDVSLYFSYLSGFKRFQTFLIHLVISMTQLFVQDFLSIARWVLILSKLQWESDFMLSNGITIASLAHVIATSYTNGSGSTRTVSCRSTNPAHYASDCRS